MSFREFYVANTCVLFDVHHISFETFCYNIFCVLYDLKTLGYHRLHRCTTFYEILPFVLL